MSGPDHHYVVLFRELLHLVSNPTEANLSILATYTQFAMALLFQAGLTTSLVQKQNQHQLCVYLVRYPLQEFS